MTTETQVKEQQQAAGKLKRQYVRFAFYQVDPAFRRLDSNVRHQAKEEIFSLLDLFKDRMMIFTYSLVGTRADADFMLWQISENLDDFENLASRLMHTGLGPYLRLTVSYLSTTKHSMYVDKIHPEHGKSRMRLQPATHPYLFVYPFVKTREWYRLPYEERQKLMDQHIAVGSKYPSVKINTTYSFGIDDQDFVVAFESDNPHDFVDLVQELREAKASVYTLRDTPAYTCIARDCKWILDAVG